MTKLATVEALSACDSLWLALDKRWLDLLDGNAKFTAELDDEGRIHIYSVGRIKK